VFLIQFLQSDKIIFCWGEEDNKTLENLVKMEFLKIKEIIFNELKPLIIC